MNNKQQQLTYDKGISNIPSDILCDDNCLEESMNIVYRDGEHQPIQDPVKLCDDNGAIQILRVHKVGSSENYIALYNDGVLGYFQKGNNGTEFKQTLLRDVSQEGLMIEAIGKTIVVRTTDDLYYFIWSGTMYKDLGTSVPKPEHVELQTYSDDNVSFDSVSNIKRDWEFYPVEVCEGVDSWQFHDENTFVGYSQAARNKAYDRKYFVFPFMARYAVEMYDGSYIHVSNPIMMFPNVRGGFFYFITNDGDNDLCFHCHCSDLQFKVQYNLSDDWSDLVKGLVIFASLPVNTVEYKIIPDGFIFEEGFARLNWVSEGVNKKYTDPYSHTTFPERPQKDIIKDLVGQENFYKVAELYNVRNTSGWVSIKDYANSRISDPGILANQPRLSDSYMEENKKWPERIFSYNGRLVLANVKRALAPIGNMFAALNSNDDGIVREYEVYVNVQTDDGEKVEHNTISTPYALQYYFFYPDIRAKRVRIYEGTKKILDGGLTESSGLNGAYYAAGWLPDLVDEGETIEQPPTDYDSTPELLSNQLYVSEVNNPWKYNASGNLTVGFGDIIGLSTQTTAISQGQFGQFPLLIFTTEGIYAASLNNEGVFTAVYPLSREVCNNPDSITQTDGAVFFSSNKGLMVVVGNDVRCVSEQLSGEFPNILKAAKIAYDYRDSLLWIASDINRDRILGEKCWVYNIKTGTFHKSSYFVGVNSGSGTKLTFNGFYSDNTPRRRVLPINSDPVPAPQVLVGAYNKANLQAMVLDSLIGAIDTGGVSAFRQYQQVDDSIIYGRIRDTGGHLTDLNGFYRYVSLYFAYPDGRGGFATRLYTKFENSDQYSTNSGQPRTDVLYYNSNFRFRWNVTRDGFDKVREFNGILAESPAEPTDIVEDGMLLGREDANDFDMIVPAGYSYNYGFKTIVFDPIRKRFILRWVRNYTKVDDSTTRDFTLYFKESALLNDYVDSTNNYHPKTDSVYQDVTNNTNYPLYRWDGSSFVHIDDTDVTQLYRISGTMEITLDDAYIIQHEEQGQTIETMSLRRGPVINCQEYDSAPYDEYDASRLQGHMKDVFIANLEAPDLDASANGVMFYTDGKEFVEQRTYSFVYNDTTYNGLMYYETFQWGVGEAAPHRPSPDVLYVLNGTSYYKWDGNDLVSTFAGLANIVNNYPDTLFHKLGDGLYSLTGRPQPEDDTNLYSGVIETRPMKLENGLALKSIMQLRNVSKMDGTVVLSMWGSNNLRSWVKLRAFRNAPWKYYRFRFEFSNMPATDRFAGTMLVTQERRTNKLR